MTAVRESVSFYMVDHVALPIVAGLYSLYKEDYNGTAWLFLSLAVNQVGIESLKDLFNTQRPNGEARSFPSGNTAAAFLGPCFLMARYGLPLKDPFVVTSVVLATLVGIGKVWKNVHWPHDIVGGALLGYMVTWIVSPLNC